MNATNSTALRKTPARSWSIARRLTVFYAVATSALLFVSGFFLYQVLVTDLETEDTKFLADETVGLRVILAQPGGDSKDLDEEVRWEGSASKLIKYYVRVLDEGGHVVAQTTGIEKLGDLSKSPFPEPFAANEYPSECEKWTSREGHTYLLMSAWAGTASGQKRLLQLASDVTDDTKVIDNYRGRLFLALLTGVVLASVAGAVIARRGLSPLRDITQSIERISATQLHERIGLEGWPRELSSLAGAFDRMMDRLEDSFGRLSQFSEDLAHELRTPIHNLMGETEVALSKARHAEDYKAVLQSNLEEFSALTRMIDSLLFLARAENPETIIEKSTFPVAGQCEVVMDYYDVLAKEKGIELSCRGDAALVADVNLFRRAIGNLIANAIRHSSTGGTVRVLIEKNKNGTVRVEVNDRGEGIPAEHLSKVFDRLYRVDTVRSRYPGGTGLGLAIVRSIMKLHGGTAAVESAPSTGTSFILNFPPSS